MKGGLPLRGVLYGLAAPVCWSIGGLVMRQVEAGGWEIVFWRSIGHGVALFAVLLLWQGGWRVAGDIREAGWAGLASAMLLAGAFVFHVLSITSTGVANTLVLQATSPFMAAALAWVLLSERVRPMTWVAMAVAFAGILPILLESPGKGNLAGDLLALGVAACSAANVIIIRHRRGRNLMPATALAGLIAGAIALAVSSPFAIPSGEAIAVLLLGLVQNTIGFTFFIMALRHLSAADVTLLSLLETVLGSAWVWIFLGEEPSGAVLLGGVAILAAVVANIATLRRPLQA